MCTSLRMSNTFQSQIVSVMEIMATAVLEEIGRGVESSASLCITMPDSQNKPSNVILPVVDNETRMAYLASVIETLAQEAVNKICKLAFEESVVLRLEVSECRSEIANLKRKLELMEKNLWAMQSTGAGETPSSTRSAGVQRTFSVKTAENEELHSALGSVCGGAGPTAAEEEFAPLKSDATALETSNAEDGIESIVIKEEMPEEDLESNDLQWRLDMSKDGKISIVSKFAVIIPSKAGILGFNIFPATTSDYGCGYAVSHKKPKMAATAATGIAPGEHQYCVEGTSFATIGAEGQPVLSEVDKNWYFRCRKDEITEQLILWRGANERLFTGKRNAALRGFATFIKDMGLEGMVTVAFMKKKWENLKQRYKELKNLPNGSSVEGGKLTAATWKWFEPMDRILGSCQRSKPPAVSLPSTPEGQDILFPLKDGNASSTTCTTLSSSNREPPSVNASSNNLEAPSINLSSPKSEASSTDSHTTYPDLLLAALSSSVAGAPSDISSSTSPEFSSNIASSNNPEVQSIISTNHEAPTTFSSSTNPDGSTSLACSTNPEAPTSFSSSTNPEAPLITSTNPEIPFTSPTYSESPFTNSTNPEASYISFANPVAPFISSTSPEIPFTCLTKLNSPCPRPPNPESSFTCSTLPEPQLTTLSCSSPKSFLTASLSTNFGALSTNVVSTDPETSSTTSVLTNPEAPSIASSSTDVKSSLMTSSYRSLEASSTTLALTNLQAPSMVSIIPESSSVCSPSANQRMLFTIARSVNLETPYTISSSTNPESLCTSPALKRAKKEPDWLLAIKELEKREEARDAREAEWERVMMEREEKREREMIRREERRNREMMEREDRRDREMREREERLIRESRVREERQAKEAAAREARFLKVMDFLLKK